MRVIKMVDIRAVHHVSLLVSDTGRALEFYRDLLGLEVDGSRPDMDYPGAWLRVGSAQIHLLELPDVLRGTERPEHGGRDRHFAMLVDDLDAAAAAAVTGGGEIAHPPMEIPGHGKFAIYIQGGIHHGLWQR